ncbi:MULTISPECIES: hypothetical protein [unclassified Streptomyces]|uniref:hypothetical protein n=1 Tax=unclassified Streptomyces TaxID=2593676 RepID=UPI00225120C0|nr:MULTISPECIES: hypothetical protein [unclassified Streptomyces]MCX5441508.1 hypothetical protein [Streptomyces sp. NBC_00063]WSE18752.1 hypothetical protein OG518_38570 [Streptomyces sp. NBC_01397]WUB92200.1 hypothetical protein OHO83_07575 [Streptomyces sp. NBC_00569]
MGEFVAAAVGFPGLLFTAALIVSCGFWVSVALGRVGADAFDADVELDAWGLGGVPVAGAVSLVIAVAWVATVTGSTLAERVAPDGMTHAALEAVLLIGSPVLGRWVARRLMGSPAEPPTDPARSDVVSGPRPAVVRDPSLAAGP